MATKKRKGNSRGRVTTKKIIKAQESLNDTPVPVGVAEPLSELRTVIPCFYCREDKDSPSSTGCPVSSHTKRSG
ncbi:hypothetical protein LCGC14_3050170 [marine sediment metagenome]|uniref:Uncharacterized protein n=1 Tax=marine sediment metagenome TaxID=412755 RepID=A0A0F8WMH7_9ZZZZ